MFHYKVTYWDDIDKITRTEAGLCGASDYSKAAKKITKYYGDENLITIVLTEWEDLVCEDDILEGFSHEID